MKTRLWFVGLCLLIAGGIIFSFNSLCFPSGDSSNVAEKIDKVYEKQKEIDTKLNEVENLMKEIKFRVYRRTGFH